MTTELDYYSARDIARATGASKKTVHRTAEREQWPARRNGNREEYAVPANIAAIIVGAPGAIHEAGAPLVRFADLAHSDTQRENVLLREKAVNLLKANLPNGKERALELAITHMQVEHPLFRLSSKITLRQWHTNYEAHGIDGLVEQKRGRVGARPFAADLSEEQILQGRAAAIEHANARRGDAKAQLNIAAAFRDLAGNPTLTGDARRWLHGDHASKSYVPPSVRNALTVPELATKLVQIGPKAMKLDGPYTSCTYDNVPAGHTFTADDMTANVYVWCEWPNEQGFLLVRPQILAVADVGSQSWLNLRAVIRPKGQYNKDDVWGLIGDTLDDYGLFKQAVLEGGTWQSDVVIGQKTNLDDDTRFGGLRSLGIKVNHTRTPRGKIIEEMFNTLQHAADNCPGYCGRNEMKDCPEKVKQAKYLVEHGHAHPRQHFLHVSQYAEHLKKVMAALNCTRNDGKVLRGRAPADKWAEDAPTLDVMPDHAKWLYRSAFRIVSVTRNGVRIGVGSGRNQIHHTWDNPTALEPHRGQRVIVFWNDSNPEADALVYSIKNSRQDKLLARAEHVPDMPRFGASDEQFEAEHKRKKLHAQVARTHAASLAPYLQRRIKAVEMPVQDTAVGEQIIEARKDAVVKRKQVDNVRAFQGSAADLLGDEDLTLPAREVAPIAAEVEEVTPAPASKSLTEKGGKFVYKLAKTTDSKTEYVDYLIRRLTEFRKAGNSFGQAIGNVTQGVVIRIAQDHLKCDLHDASRFDEVCGYLQDKIDATILGKRNAAKGTSSYHAFEADEAAVSDLSPSALLG